MSARWRDVFVDLTQYAKDKHGTLECVACHTSSLYASYPHPKLTRDQINPSSPSQVKATCGACHAEITSRHLNSLHNTLEGHRVALVDLMGEKEGAVRFEGCKSCHASCTECHMKQPDRYNRLVSQTETHQFTKEPSANVCQVCHGQTGNSFLGIPGDVGHGPSLMSQAGLQCIDCHTEKEVHGDGSRPQFIAQTRKPTCEECHSHAKPSVPTLQNPVAARQFDASNPAHQTHVEKVDCVACHTQWYTNCWNCHKGEAQVRTDKFYLAVNPLTGKIHTAVHSPINQEFGNVDPEIGGWAVKTRHSWGKSQPCEKCHTNSEVYIEGKLRQGKFVGVWIKEKTKGSFVNDKLVKQILLDPAQIKQSAHRNQSCLDCHKSVGDETCTVCHANQADRARGIYRNTHAALAQADLLIAQIRADGYDVATLQKEWEAWRDQYLATANLFHSKPGEAQKQMQGLNEGATKFAAQIKMDLNNRKQLATQLITGVPLVVGLMAMVVTGWFFMRRKSGASGKGA